MSALITGKLLNEPEINSAKKVLTHSIYFKHWCLTKGYQNQRNQIAKTEFLI